MQNQLRVLLGKINWLTFQKSKTAVAYDKAKNYYLSITSPDNISPDENALISDFYREQDDKNPNDVLKKLQFLYAAAMKNAELLVILRSDIYNILKLTLSPNKNTPWDNNDENYFFLAKQVWKNQQRYSIIKKISKNRFKHLLKK